MGVPLAHPCWRSERGSLLLVALLVLLALASIGLVFVRKVSIEQGVIGNERRGAVAFHVTESGAYSALAYADSLGPAGFLAMVDQAANQAGPGNPAIWKADHLLSSGLDYFDMAQSGSFGFEGNVASLDPSAALNPPMEFQITVDPSGMLQPLMGYSLTGAGSRCRFKYRFDTDGNVGGAKGADSGQTFSAWKRIRALMNVGPLPCDRAASGVGAT